MRRWTLGRSSRRRISATAASGASIGAFGERYLDAYVFESIAEVRAVTEEWTEGYKRERPHNSLDRVPLLTFPRRQEPARKCTFEVST